MDSHSSIPVRVEQPLRIPAWSLAAERTDQGPGYKPSLALLPDNRLLLVTMAPSPPGENLPPGKLREWTGIQWSEDGGRTWGERRLVEDMIGREQWLTCNSRGTVFATSHLLPQDVNNEDGVVTSWIHRSDNGGTSWERTRATVDGPLRNGVPPDCGSHTSRNVVELPDGTLLFGVSIGQSNVAYLWKSTDDGKSWDTDRHIAIRGYYENMDGFFAEDFTYINDSGQFLHWCRVGPFGYSSEGDGAQGMFPMSDSRPLPPGDDGIDRMMWTRSEDDGMTWSPLRDFGDYGSHYPRVLRLRDGRLLMTYTQRSTFYPLGLRAILSYDDGETWNWERDRIVIEGFTPWGRESGGGFGNTMQWHDGTLLSCYSYRNAASEYRVEVVRWTLP